MNVCYKLIIFGKVQGVNFRNSTYQKALELNLSGWVKNTPDGKVQVHVEGDAYMVNQFIEWCKSGPPSAEVLKVELELLQMENYTDFTILR